MAKAWISDRWLKKTTITLDDGSTIQSEATAAAKRSLAANTAHPQRANVPQQYRTAEYGHGSRWAVFWRADGKRKRRNFSDYHEAEAFAAGLEDDIRSCRYIDPDDELRVFSEAAELWVAGLHGTVKESSEARYRRELRIWVLPRWADIPVGRITTGAIQRWVAQLVEGKAPRNGKTGTAGPLADRYIRTIVKIVTKNVLDLAVSEGWILKNPMDGVKLPKAKASTKRVYLVPQEIKCIADEMSRDDATGVFLLAYTGIRIGELLALRCGDVDFERKRLTISKTLSIDVEGLPIETLPKGNRERTVPIPGHLIHRLHLLAEKHCDSDYLVRAPRGGRNSIQNWRNRVWTPALQSAGMDEIEGLVPHSLRHSYASPAIKAGADVKTLQSVMGHASATETLDTYADLWPNRMSDVAEAIDSDIML